MPRATGPRPAELHPGAPGRARRGRADHHNMKTTAVVARHPLLYRGPRAERSSCQEEEEGEEAKGGAGEGAATIRAVESCTAGRTELFLLGPSS
ncbi:unnamed protein product [Prorocentrum cordatum]|uniref:Uncharacterized protein n=1 Tax=Prorocentrum cordatum TaxID=2364126 RepID=A0ABN9QR26_9DINO|nr:unnamed protein product [Polarella glacialis]